MCESAILAHQSGQENIVVTTDPSIVLNEKNKELSSSEFIVYLKASTRVQSEPTPHQPSTLLSLSSKKEFFDQSHKKTE